ncbi:Alpha/beta hydrolase fold-3 [Penicillium cf. griseofulvum]|uniref:Alpha/beta hydrolase fold-3 n=1 Tax=Penicillium cf. griseofulvum TaxID=2972120 RepID=A0A9W9J215_9EURO|nr:Alpha/beta hydrolase fold-3 [Penicillium cf. griseofulvum]KAJ5434058.1 Alpha/beta hydrolase fold-3 [Penicillium cf. griseofulvum]KAJ5451890.1 Alpha/beta hydrolase fold-3 [Penicillium cf. griseofulvum]
MQIGAKPISAGFRSCMPHRRNANKKRGNYKVDTRPSSSPLCFTQIKIMSKHDVPELGFWEKADIPFLHLSVFASMVYSAITGVFRGKSSPKRYDHHVLSGLIRKLVDRRSDRQTQYLSPPTSVVYGAVMKKRGLEPETVALPHGAEGHWLGNKNAKNVIVYYHGGGFAMPAITAYFDFWLEMLNALNATGHDLAVFFPRYTLTPHATYPTQLRQAVEALRYIINETGRSPANVIIGGDSAGGNLTAATLLHLSHPHAEIEPLDLSAPLAGAFTYAPWINFSTDWPSMKENQWKDIVTTSVLNRWSASYRADKPADNWNEPFNAPAEWWSDVRAKKILVLVGGDEILLSPIQEFVKKIKSVFEEITVVVGEDESHDAPFYTMTKEQTQTGTELRQWLAARL